MTEMQETAAGCVLGLVLLAIGWVALVLAFWGKWR